MADNIDRFRQQVADYNASRHLALYRHTGNGLLIWKAYHEYRKEGLPVPENILAKLDQYAERLLDPNGPELLDALDLAFNTKGGAGPRRALTAKESSRDVVERVAVHQEATGGTLTDSYLAVAHELLPAGAGHDDIRRKAESIKKLWQSWPKRKRRW